MQGQARVAGSEFERIIAPVTPEQFFAQYFERQHLVVHRTQPDYYRRLLDLADIDRVLTETILPQSDINLVNNGQGVDKADYTLETGQVDPVRVTQAFAEGATIVLSQLHRRLPRLAAYCRALEAVFSCDLQTNIYLTPDNAQGFKTHYDSHDVLVLQVEGTKTWRIYDSPLVLPLQGQRFRPDGFVPGAVIDEFVLQPGDMAYIPRGVVHDAIATETVSLHITTGLLGKRWLDLVLEAAAAEGLRNPALRASLPPGFANEGFDRTGARETLRALLAGLAERADADELLDSLARSFRDSRLPAVPGQFLQSLGAAQIGPETEVGARPDLICRLRPAPLREGEEAEIVLDVYGAEVAFPAWAEETLRDILGQGRVRVADLAGDLDDGSKAVLVRRLVQEGVVRVFA